MDYIYVPDDNVNPVSTSGSEALKYMARRLGNNVKFMYMVRDPLDLIWHSYCHESGKAPASLVLPPNRTLEAQDIEPFDINKPVNLSHHINELATQYISQYLK